MNLTVHSSVRSPFPRTAADLGEKAKVEYSDEGDWLALEAYGDIYKNES